MISESEHKELLAKHRELEAAYTKLLADYVRLKRQSASGNSHKPQMSRSNRIELDHTVEPTM